MRRLRINLILPRVNLAGGLKSNRLIAEAMVRRGHDVTLAYVNAGVPWPKPWRVRTLAKRLLVEWKGLGRPKHHLVESAAKLLPVNREVIRPGDVPDADVTIATWWETAEWIRAWPASKGLKAHFVRGYEVFGGEPERVRAVYRIPLLKLAISTWLRDLMVGEFGQSNVVLVPNGVDWSQFDSEPRGKAAVPTVGLMYGRQALKGAATAFEAIRLARQQIPALRVVAFGARPPLPEHKPPEGMEFVLRPEQSEIPKLYRSTDCWILPSTSEGFGMPGLEAAACRCPVIATRCGGPADYVQPGVNGYLVDVGDAQEVARRIIDVVRADDPRWREMSEASYRIAKGFDWDRSAGILESTLISAVEQRGAA